MGVPLRTRLVSTNYSLFEEPSSFDREALAARLRGLAANGIFIGGSSWKYEGWLGQIYTESRYTTRGRFSKRGWPSTIRRTPGKVTLAGNCLANMLDPAIASR